MENIKDVIVESFHDFSFEQFKVPFITVYNNPLDRPEKMVARLFDTNQPTVYCVIADTMDEIRETIPKSFINLGRDKRDEKHIVTVFMMP